MNPKPLLHLEGAAVFIASLFAYQIPNWFQGYTSCPRASRHQMKQFLFFVIAAAVFVIGFLFYRSHFFQEWSARSATALLVKPAPSIPATPPGPTLPTTELSHQPRFAGGQRNQPSRPRATIAH